MLSSTGATSTVAVGDILSGKYAVERVLGHGSMGVVVAARHMQLDQLLAVKLMPAEAALDSIAVRRFQQEARAAARLRSDHVARVVDVGELPTGEPFMVMEYLAGVDLAAVLERDGPLPVGVACDYVVQACDAVGEAHAMGIVHRDLKPENLHLSTDLGGQGFVKVLDFGVSKLMTTREGALTTTKMAVGSPLYMAPEQLRSSRRVDQRADVWALGVVLYELLTRRLPFEAESLPDLCLKVVREEPRRIAELRADVPRGVLAVIARCLEKDPGDRYANATELAAALTPFTPQRAPAVVDSACLVQSLVSTLPGAPVEASTVAPARRGHARWLAAGVAMVVALGASGLVLRAHGDAPPPLAFAAVGAALDSWSTSVEVTPVAVVPEAPAVAPTLSTATPSRAAGQPHATRVAPRPRPADDDIPAFR